MLICRDSQSIRSSIYNDLYMRHPMHHINDVMTHNLPVIAIRKKMSVLTHVCHVCYMVRCCTIWDEDVVCKLTSVTLTHWGRVTHICVGNLATIGSDNGLSPGRRQAIIRTNAGILLIGPEGTNFSEILIGIQTFSLKKIHLKMSSGKCRPFFPASMC